MKFMCLDLNSCLLVGNRNVSPKSCQNYSHFFKFPGNCITYWFLGDYMPLFMTRYMNFFFPPKVIHIATQKPEVILFVIPRVMLDFICAASLLVQIVFILSWTNLIWYKCWNCCDVVLLSFVFWLTVSVYC